MTSYTTLVEFRVPEAAVTNPVDCQTSVQELTQYLGELGFEVGSDLTAKLAPNNGFLINFHSSTGSYATLRGYANGLITLDLTEIVEESGQPIFTREKVSDFEEKVQKSLKCLKTKSLPAIRRGAQVDCYIPTVDNLLVEYDFDACVYEAQSPYQHISIMHSRQHGNVLILDGDPNLAEGDLSYTKAITGDGREQYGGKTVLILGGGDGGILKHLLQEKPSFITMVDIDGMVVEAAKKHLRGICGDTLDQLKGDNYEVIIGDCVPYLEKYLQEGRTFDFVISDLCAIPIATRASGDVVDTWQLMRNILDLAIQVLAPTGKFYSQGNSFNFTEGLRKYELQLDTLAYPVDFRKHVTCVPSYHELWVFYELWKTGGKKEKQQ